MPAGAHALHFGYVLRARGRWNRAGEYGALYLAETEAGARAEHAKHCRAAGLAGLQVAKRELVTVDVQLRHVLDLTDLLTQQQYGVTEAMLIADDDAYAAAHRTADLARASGFFALIVPSAALAGARNVIVYPDAAPARDVELDAGSIRKPLD